MLENTTNALTPAVKTTAFILAVSAFIIGGFALYLLPAYVIGQHTNAITTLPIALGVGMALAGGWVIFWLEWVENRY